MGESENLTTLLDVSQNAETDGIGVSMLNGAAFAGDNNQKPSIASISAALKFAAKQGGVKGERRMVLLFVIAATTDGKKLAIAAMGGLYLYDLESENLTTLLGQSSLPLF